MNGGIDGHSDSVLYFASDVSACSWTHSYETIDTEPLDISGALVNVSDSMSNL